MQRIGFLGCGRVAQCQMEVCHDELKNARVIIVYDQDREKTGQHGEELGGQVIYDMRDLLSSKEVDVISIMT